jgi:hypothetical protein
MTKGRGKAGILSRLKIAGKFVLTGRFEEKPRLVGHYEHRLLLPIRVSDPEKVISLFPLMNKELLRLLSRQVLAESTANRLIRFCDGRKPLLRELSRCLSGGGLKWADAYDNIVVNEGLNHILDVVLSSGTQDTSWFLGLLGASPSPLAAWTATELASNDFVAYDEATLQAFVDGGVASQSCSNSASPAVFTISTNGSSIGGAYLIGTNAKATPAGTVYSAGAFSGGNKAADDGDTLEVTATFSAADDGV